MTSGTRSRVALRPGTLIDGSGRPPVHHATVLIDDGKLIAVGPRIEVPHDYRRVDIPGSTLIPGLIDAHTHLEVIRSGAEYEDHSGEIWRWHIEELARYGVTAVRDTGGTGLGESYRELQAEMNTDWPRFVGSGPNLDGPPGAPYPGLRVVNSPEEAAKNAAELIADGVPFLKTYVWLPFEELQAVVAVAHRMATPVAAHVGNVLTVEQALSAGVDAFEHICSGRELLDEKGRAMEAELPTREHDWVLSMRPWRFVELNGPRVEHHLELLADSAATITPTLAILRVFCQQIDPMSLVSERSDTPKALAAAWEQGWPTTDYSNEDADRSAEEWQAILTFVDMAHKAGVNIVAGTDFPNPGTYPGSSLHQEIRDLANAGLGIVGAIAAATGKAAQLMGRDDIGLLRAGRKADLLVLDGDLSVDLSPLGRIQAVVRQGEIRARSAEMDALLSS